MASPLHLEVAEIAREKGAMLISRPVLSAFVLNGLHSATQGLAGAVFPTRHKLVSAEFESLSVPPKNLQVELVSLTPDVVLVVKPEFSFFVRLGYAADMTKTFARFEFKVSNLSVRLSGQGALLALTPEFQDVEVLTDVTPAARTEAIAASGIASDELLRVEGSFAYGTGNALLSSALGQLRTIDLAKMFPNVAFAGKLQLETTNDALLIIPESMTLTPWSGCAPFDPTRGLSVEAQQAIRSGDNFSFGVNAKFAPLTEPKVNERLPDVAVYAPKPLLDARFGTLSPALTYVDEGSGVIGHVVRLTAAIKRITITIQGGALRLSLGLKLWGLGSLNIEVPCLGRQEFGRIEADLPESGEADISVDLRLGVDTSARVLLTSEIVGMSLGEAKVSFSLFGSALSLVKPNIYGYITDFIVGRIVQHNLPGLVFDAIKEALDHQYVVVADLGDYLSFLKMKPNMAMYSGTDESALMGLNYLG